MTRAGLFVMPNPWDVGSARVLESWVSRHSRRRVPGSRGRSASSTSRCPATSWSAHVAGIAAATELPLNVDSERCYPDDPGGDRGDGAHARRSAERRVSRSRTTTRRAAASSSVEDAAAKRRRRGRSCARSTPSRWFSPGGRRTTSAGVDDLDDTISRLVAYRDAGADAVYAPGLSELDQIAAVVEAVGNPGQRSRTAERADHRGARVRRRAQGLDRRRARRCCVRSALGRALAELQADGTSRCTETNISRDALLAAFR